ncbi:cobyrinate a,c-diamide synthase [Sporosarcina sp. G11-34]|uniref:cobyrinate a,c-diamide synthase n=1 Tax=Sporosarcina sp. G11-34 TaxID=2849605 RepID=UPI0022A9413B|nr:cobyrinate a,c-diamide synthase [Sporosarcina sp. G11-34]MCZ2257464.1 cobyrinate a,c-diamide synthase [Sporosarcina sp. G11-34]
MSERRLVIAGTGSGVGKTTVTIGLMSAFKKRGLVVQGFKCGPDYIDPSYHTAVTKRVSRNLDSWMLGEETVLDIFEHGSNDADISIMEGVMGFFDGKDPKTNVGSTAEISMITKSPVLLVVNCASMARSAAAIVKGFQTLSSGSNIVGVIANQVGGEGHYEIVKTAIEQECQIPVVGYLKREGGIEIPERSLGLIPSIERGELDPFFDRLGDLILETIDLDKLLEISVAQPLDIQQTNSIFEQKRERIVRIAVAKDAAFNSYYMENLEILESYGAELVYFSPLMDDAVPEDIDGLYIGGSFPEEFARSLGQNERMKASLRQAFEIGIPTFAEGGGFMYLTNSVETTEGETFGMVDFIPAKIKMHTKLQAIGYREISGCKENFLLGEHQSAKGHEFHYATFESAETLQHAYETKGMRGTKTDGFVTDNVIAGYTQFHFATCLEMVEKWIQACLIFQKR